MSSDLFAKMDEMLEKAPEGRASYFQIKYFVIGKEPTLQGQLWQCLRELQARRRMLDSMSLQIEDAKDRLSLLELKHAARKIKLEDRLGESGDVRPLLEAAEEVKRRRAERRRKILLSSIRELEEKYEFTLQEARFIMQMYETLSKLEVVKDYDDYASQVEYFNEKLGGEINLKMLLQQPLDTELVKTVLAMPDSTPIKMQTVKTLDHIQSQMERLKDSYGKRLREKETNASKIEQS